MKFSRHLFVLTSAVLAGTGTVPLVAGAAEPTPTRVTEWVSDDGGSAGRELPAVSADGRYVVFVGRSSGQNGIYVKDRAHPQQPARRLASGNLFNPDISADGTVVAWAPYGSGTGGQSVMVWEWQRPGAVPEMVSLGDDGAVAQGADFPSLSENGRYVAFQSKDKTLDDDVAAGQQGGGPTKVYVRDRVTHDTEMVSVADATSGPDQIVNGNALLPDITPDGRYVAFASDASSLQGSDGEGEAEVSQQVFVRDRQAGTTTPVSVAPDGTTFGDAASASHGYQPTISDDGTKVAFDSDAANLVAGDTNDDTDAFVRDMTTGTTVRVSLTSTGAQADVEPPDWTVEPPAAAAAEEGPEALPAVGAGPAISGNGAYVAFESLAALTPDDQNSGDASCTPDPEGPTTSGWVDVADVYRTALDPAGAVVPGSVERQSVTTAVPGAPETPQEARGFRVDGMTGACTAAANGIDPAITRDGARVAFVSNGNLTGRTAAEEEGESALPADETEPEDSYGIEPSVFLRRPEPEPDVVAPTSVATSPAKASTATFAVTYSASDPGFPSTGVARVDLYVQRPGQSTWTRTLSDVGPAVDHLFTVTTDGAAGTYRFYTVATDAAGNVEAAPATYDAATVLDLGTPPVVDTQAPAVTRLRARPNPFDISRDHRVRVVFGLSERAHVSVAIRRHGHVVRHLASGIEAAGVVTHRWYGRNDAGRLVGNGWYRVVVRAVDLAGNASVQRMPLHVHR